jgi:hypothetical protein
MIHCESASYIVTPVSDSSNYLGVCFEHILSIYSKGLGKISLGVIHVSEKQS